MAQATQENAPQAQARKPLTVKLFGRIEAVTRREGNGAPSFRTLVKTPSADEFSAPDTFEVRSKGRLGQAGDTVTLDCRLKGYARSYEGKDGATVRTAEAVFEAVE